VHVRTSGVCEGGGGINMQEPVILHLTFIYIWHGWMSLFYPQHVELVSSSYGMDDQVAVQGTIHTFQSELQSSPLVKINFDMIV
jgi:hypothetical protein